MLPAPHPRRTRATTTGSAAPTGGANTTHVPDGTASGYAALSTSATFPGRARPETAELARLLVLSTVSPAGKADGRDAATRPTSRRPGEDLARWHGFVPSASGGSPKRGVGRGYRYCTDEAYFADSMSTKVVEYMAHGVPVVMMLLPARRRAGAERGTRFAVPRDVAAAADAVVRLGRDRTPRQDGPARL